MRLSSIASARRNPKAVPVAAPVSRVRSFPAPTRGWNARDALPEMKPSDAIILDNYIPTTSDTRLRNGSVDHATGIGGAVETLISYSAGSTDELWAIGNNSLFNVTASGAVGAATESGYTNSRWQYTNFSTSGSHFLIGVNGADSLRIYDGTTWHPVTGVSSPYAITGVATTSLTNLFVYKNRLFFLAQNSLQFYYLPVDSIAGAATAFDLGPEFQRGGYLVAGGSWTRDGGDGMDDLAIFVTNHGECVIYAGSDPGDATVWTKIGRYDIPPPIGNRCIMRWGADVLVITIDGVFSIGQILSLNRAKEQAVSVSDRIRNAFNGAAALYSTAFGWEAVAYPKSSMVLFNVPISEGTEQHQYVLNAITGAWCRFKGWNANCWALFGEKIYYGSNDGKVVLADFSDNDNGVQIEGLIQTAYIQHDGEALKKHYHMVKPIMSSMYGLAYGVGLLTDYSEDFATVRITNSGVSGDSQWDSATWNSAPWATIVPITDWQGASALGTCVSVVMRSFTLGIPIVINSFSIMYEVGGAL